MMPSLKRIHSVLSQPAITPLFKTRQAAESLLVWAGESNTEYFTVLKEYWRTAFIMPVQALTSKASGISVLYDGVYELAWRN
jgi:hypothetical protein